MPPPPPPRRRSALARYGFAVASVVVATGLRAALTPLVDDQFPFVTFFPAVLLAAWYGGLGPALLATVLGGVSATFFFLEPALSLEVAGSRSRQSIVVYGVISAAVVLFGQAVHRTSVRAA